MVGIPRGFERFQPWWRGWYQGYGFNPVADLPGLALYHDIKVQDSTFQGLPGMAYAINQNDGIGAVLDIKRYRERGVEIFSGFDSLESGWSADGDGGYTHAATPGDETFSGLQKTGLLTTGTVYEMTLTIISYSANAGAGGGVGLSSITAGSGSTYTKAGTYRILFRAASDRLRVTVRNSSDAQIGGISIREIPGYHAIQDVAANQPTLNIENGIRSALFDGVDDRLSIPNSKDAFNFLHDGTGGEIFAALKFLNFDIKQYLFGNGNVNGIGVYMNVSTNGGANFRVFNGGSTPMATATASGGTFSVEEPVVISCESTLTHLRIRKNGAVVAESEVSGTHAQVSADTDFTAGHFAPNGGSFRGDMYTLPVAIQGSLSDYQRQRLTTYMLRRAGA